jgi:hypothetical protein
MTTLRRDGLGAPPPVNNLDRWGSRIATAAAILIAAPTLVAALIALLAH